MWGDRRWWNASDWMSICIPLLSLWNPFLKMVAFNDALVCDETFYVRLYWKKTFLYHLVTFSLCFYEFWYSVIRVAAPIMQTFELTWMDYNCWEMACLGHLAHWYWRTDFFSLCFAVLWPQVCNGHKSGEGILYHTP